MTRWIRGAVRVATMATILTAMAAGPAVAGPFNSAPGARARAMGGAFAAVADDASAAWHNPAGLAGRSERVATGEWGQGSAVDDPSGDVSGENAFFVGGHYAEPEYAVGAFFLTPYTIQYFSMDPGGRNEAFGKVEESIQVVSVPLAIAPGAFEGRLKFGGTVEWVRSDIGGSEIVYRDDTGFANGYAAAEDSASDVSGSLSVLAHPVDTKQLRLSLGATYRFGAAADIGEEARRNDGDTGVSDLFFDKPPSYDVGAAVTVPLGRQIQNAMRRTFLTVSAQYGKTDWGEANDGDIDLEYDRYSGGLEVAFERERAQVSRWALRGGYYLSDPTGNAAGFDWPEATGISYGLGITMGQVTLDLAQEYRTLENDTGLDDSALLTSAALSLRF
ncbi:MAG: hypothetical protein ACLFQQ_07895 [Desulfococcaceae bacterium]